MLGAEIEALLRRDAIEHLSSDQDVDIGDPVALRRFVSDNRLKTIKWIINCSGYTAVDRAEDEPKQAFRINARDPGQGDPVRVDDAGLSKGVEDER